MTCVQGPDRQAIEALVTPHLDLVPILARQLGRELGIPSRFLEDLESAGREGLVGAAQRFDAERGVPFRRFAHHRVRGAMLDALRREAALPKRAYARVRQLEAALSLNEVASEELAAPPAAPTTPASLDARLAEHLANLATAMASGLLAETAQDDGVSVTVDPLPSPEETLARAELRAELQKVVDELPEQERTLVAGHYFQDRRFDEVAAGLGLSKSWASRLHTRAIAKITRRLRAIT